MSFHFMRTTSCYREWLLCGSLTEQISQLYSCIAMALTEILGAVSCRPLCHLFFPPMHVCLFPSFRSLSSPAQFDVSLNSCWSDSLTRELNIECDRVSLGESCIFSVNQLWIGIKKILKKIDFHLALTFIFI